VASPIEAEFARRTPRSAAERGRSARLLAPGALAAGPLPHPLYLAAAAGSRLHDLDGHEYLDLWAGGGGTIAGHAHPVIAEAVRTQLDRGLSPGMHTDLAGRIAGELRQRYPGLDVVSLTNSGAEAIARAVRLARAATGRPGVLRTGDMRSRSSGSAARPWPQAVAYDDPAAVEKAFGCHPRAFAAVIVEPVRTRNGVTCPDPGYLPGLREITAEHGTALVFDETRTAFRIGQVTEDSAVRPDLVALGEAAGGGRPLGAVIGLRGAFEPSSPPARIPAERAVDPLSLAAGLACLTSVLTVETLGRMERLAAQLADGLRAITQTYALPLSVNQAGSVGSLQFCEPRGGPDPGKWAEYWLRMVNRGVIPAGDAWYEPWFISAAHTRADVDIALDTAEDVLVKLYGA
jgi:glutamate-1-semialdehyde 2,1-aminomutase